MENYTNILKNKKVLLLFGLITILIFGLSYLDDRANQKNKKTTLGHCKLVLICNMSALVMLIGYIYITSAVTIKVQPNNLTFIDKFEQGEPNF